MDFPLFKQGAWVRECLKKREKKTKHKTTEESGLRITAQRGSVNELTLHFSFHCLLSQRAGD